MKKLVKNALVYKLAILIAILFTINSAAMACSAAFLHTDWATLTVTKRFVLICLIVGNFSNTMLAFFNKTLSRIEQGKSFIETGDTQPPFLPSETTIVK